MGEQQPPSLVPPQEEAPPLFAVTMNELNHGETLDEASDVLRSLVATVREIHRKGSMTVKLKVAPRTAEMDCREVTILAEVKADIPKPVKGDTIFYANRNGDLSRQPFEQGQLFELKKAEGQGA